MRGKKRSEAALASERKAIDDFIGRKSNGHFLEADWKPSHFTQSVLGEGYGGTVRLVSVEGSHCHSATVYAVKEFSRKKDDSTKHYSLRIEPEFYAAFKLKHAHVVQVFDTLPVSSKTSLYCQVMEYCHGRDLFYHVSRTSFGLVPEEANCFFRQLLSGVAYMHSVGLAHRDLKPENLLLTADGCLKIADFGASVRFTTHADGDTVVHSRGITGTMPYIAPEIFCQRKYDARLVDVWGCVIIYKLLRTKEYSWFVAKGTDIHFKKYVRSRVKAGQWEILEGLEDGPRDLLYQMLEPEPGSRIHISGILKNAWFCSISSCHQ
ncbi:kinase-like domain-containing protein [Spinellus fusiger]|nr:kinase-like domain-containing protein [Spinellus fusiger]